MTIKYYDAYFSYLNLSNGKQTAMMHMSRNKISNKTEFNDEAAATRRKRNTNTHIQKNTTMGNRYEVRAPVMWKFCMKADYISIVIVYDEIIQLSRAFGMRGSDLQLLDFVYVQNEQKKNSSLRSKEKVFSS